MTIGLLFISSRVPRKAARDRVEGIDRAVPEVADQEVIAEGAEIGRAQSQSPGRVERAVGNEALHEVAVRVVHIYKAIARSCHIIMFRRILLSVGDIKAAPEVLDIERGETRRYVGVREVTGEGLRSKVVSKTSIVPALKLAA